MSRPRASSTTMAVFAACGPDGWGPAQELRGVPDVHLVATPRHATVLLVTGSIASGHRAALQRVHDQLPHPRTTVGWRRAGVAVDVPAARDVDGGADTVTAALRAAYAAVVDDPARSAPDLLPDQDPNVWRGVGPFGQGGEGMMGGTPYGRPMAMTGDDRDGLALDQLHLSLGPFLDAVPAGLILDVVLQGEVLLDATPHLTARRPANAAHADPCLPEDPTLAEARRGLQWLAHALHVAGLDALAARSAALALRTIDAADRDALASGAARVFRAVRRSGVLRGLAGIGVDPDGGDDAAARWRRRIDATAGAIAGDPVAGDHPSEDVGTLLAGMLPGMTLADAIATVVSLDICRPVVRV